MSVRSTGSPTTPSACRPGSTWPRREDHHEIDICYLNVNELHILSEAELRPRGRRNYVIGYWFWELPALASGFVDQVQRLDEIWVGSRFTKDALLGHTTSPIQVMPCVVEAPVPGGASRKDLDLPEGTCIFFFHFDAMSHLCPQEPVGRHPGLP